MYVPCTFIDRKCVCKTSLTVLAPPGPLTFILDSADTLLNDLESIGTTYSILHRLTKLLSARKGTHLLLPCHRNSKLNTNSIIHRSFVFGYTCQNLFPCSLSPCVNFFLPFTLTFTHLTASPSYIHRNCLSHNSTS